MDPNCVVVYKKRHGEKVVAVVVLQTGETSSSGLRNSQVYTFVCQVHTRPDSVLKGLRQKGGANVVEALTPVQWSESAVCQLPTLPDRQGTNQDKATYQLYVDGWVANSAGVSFEAIALAAISHANALDGLGTSVLTSWPSELVGETLVAGVFGAWAFTQVRLDKQGRIDRSLAHRRPLVRALEIFLPLVGSPYNNAEIYGYALGFGMPKAHKDVRTYRETVKRIDEERRGQK